MKHFNFIVNRICANPPPCCSKRASRFVWVLVLMLTLGIGQMWGTDELVYTLDGTITGTGSGYGTANDITQGEKDWKVTGNTTMNPWRLGGKGITNQNRNIYTTFTFSEDISKVTVQTGATGNSLTVNSVKLIVSASQNGGGDKEEISKTSSLTNTTLTFSRPSGHDWSGKYFTIVFNVTRSSSSGSNGYVEFKNAKFYKEAAVAHTVTLMDDTSHPLQEQSAGAGVTLPTRTGCTGYTFAGWTASWVEEQDEWTTIAPTIISAGTYHPAADVSLYPVYTKSEGGDGFTLSLTYSNTEYYIAPRSGSNTYFGVTTTAEDAETFYIDTDTLYIYEGNAKTYVNIDDNNTSIDFRTAQTPTAWTITESNSVWTFQSKGAGTRHLAWNYNQGSPRFAAYTGSNTYLYQYSKHDASTTSYISVPNCCTELGQINGSFLGTTHFGALSPEKFRPERP